MRFGMELVLQWSVRNESRCFCQTTLLCMTKANHLEHYIEIIGVLISMCFNMNILSELDALSQ